MFTQLDNIVVSTGKKTITLYIAGSVLCTLTVLIRWQHIPDGSTLHRALFACCDGSFAAGICITGAGLFTAVKNAGAFSALSWGFATLRARLRLARTPSEQKETHTYFDYVHTHRSPETRRAAAIPYVITAGTFFIGAVISLAVLHWIFDV
ncbi:MAG: DUF3899 domain-containing protein [Treponema sp.]|nr:DUF3899 domain-containing protein [Treponema sp.]